MRQIYRSFWSCFYRLFYDLINRTKPRTTKRILQKRIHFEHFPSSSLGPSQGHNLRLTWQYLVKSLTLEHFPNLESRSFHLAPRFVGLIALLMEKSAVLKNGQFCIAWLYYDLFSNLVLFHLLYITDSFGKACYKMIYYFIIY